MADSRYVLMHKNTPVAAIQLAPDTGVIRSVGHVYNALHVPVGIPVKKGVIDRSALNTWWTGRAIPASRDRIRDALRELELCHDGHRQIEQLAVDRTMCQILYPLHITFSI